MCETMICFATGSVMRQAKDWLYCTSAVRESGDLTLCSLTFLYGGLLVRRAVGMCGAKPSLLRLRAILVDTEAQVMV